MRKYFPMVLLALSALAIAAIWRTDDSQPYFPRTNETVQLEYYYPVGLPPFQAMCRSLQKKDDNGYRQAQYAYAYVLERDVNVGRFAGAGWPLPPNPPTWSNYRRVCAST